MPFPPKSLRSVRAEGSRLVFEYAVGLPRGARNESDVERHVAEWILARRRGVTWKRYKELALDTPRLHIVDMTAVLRDARAAIAGMRDLLETNAKARAWAVDYCERPCRKFAAHIALCQGMKGHGGPCLCETCHEERG